MPLKAGDKVYSKYFGGDIVITKIISNDEWWFQWKGQIMKAKSPLSMFQKSDNLNWKKLMEHNCPKCSELLKMGLLDLNIKCTNCIFSISREKYDSIMNSMLCGKAYQPTEEENLSKLNNL